MLSIEGILAQLRNRVLCPPEVPDELLIVTARAQHVSGEDSDKGVCHQERNYEIACKDSRVELFHVLVPSVHLCIKAAH